MTVQFWWGSHHAVMCAAKACAENLATAAATNKWTDAFEPSLLPVKPTAYANPYNLVPTNGSFYCRPMRPGDSARPVPFIEFGLETADPTLVTDDEADFMEVRVTIRVCIGTSTGTPINGQAILESQALALCTLAVTVAGDYLRATALAADPAGAFGICYAEIRQRPTLDFTGPRQITGTGSAGIYAAATLSVYQRQFAVAGIGQTATNP